MTPRPVIFGCAGRRLTAEERRFFRDVRPLGLILFARNIETPEQVRSLVAELRTTIGREQAPVLIDQEGGRVARLTTPHWRHPPPAAEFGACAERDPEAATRAAWLNARLIAADLGALGITVDCLPLIDVRAPSGHAIIGDRAFADRVEPVVALGRATAEGLLAGGVLPVIKHIPGHGRAGMDSHLELPRVATARGDLEAIDFRPFKALADMPLAMTAHVVYEAIDASAAATVSARVVANVIRGHIGFQGILMTDDLDMKALTGSLGGRARAALAAGCDVVLQCSGQIAQMREIADALRPVSPAIEAKLKAGFAAPQPLVGFEREAALRELTDLIG